MALASRFSRRWFLYGGVVLVLGAAVWYFAAGTGRARTRYPQPGWAGADYPPLIPVKAATAAVRDLPQHLKAIGTVVPLATVTVRSRVSGPLLRVDFQEGQRVEQGQLLAEVDPAPYQIALAQAEGQLQQNAARLQTARTDFERLRGLHDKHLITDQELETQRALVTQYEGLQTTSQAQVDTARLQLAWTRIESPISGRAGIRRMDPGNLVVANDTNGLVVVTQTRPINVQFTIPEVALPPVIDAYHAGRPVPVEVWDRNETAVLATGVLKTVDNQIDTTTGTLRLRAELPNPDEKLFPNQFVNVRMQVGTIPHAVVIPGMAVQFGSRGTYVYVVGENRRVSVRLVTLGAADGADQAIASGLKAGERVVIEGLDRLREGRKVIVVNDGPRTGATAATP